MNFFRRDLNGAAGDEVVTGELSLEPGVLRRLRASKDISFSPTSDSFLVHMARSISSRGWCPVRASLWRPVAGQLFICEASDLG
jgi:hypothetical protein